MRKYLIIILAICSLHVNILVCWSKLYSTQITDLVSSDSKNKKIEWTKRAINEFNQLVFSFNALRPKEGSYTFWVKIRDKATKKWYSWSKMAVWGKDKAGAIFQKTFSNKNKDGIIYNYVRLELPSGKLADGFKICVKSDTLHTLDINSLTVNAYNTREFKSEVGSKFFRNLKSVEIKNLPKYSQMVLDHPKFEGLCSPTSVSMVLGFLLKKEIEPVLVANSVYDSGLDIYGSWPFNIAHVYDASAGNLTSHTQRLKSFMQIYDYLSKNIPVIVSIRGPISGGATPYANGHLLVITGYNKEAKKIICHDPAFASNDQVLASYDLNEFIRAWEKSYRLAYIIT
jgi:Peptidase_C39 like family